MNGNLFEELKDLKDFHGTWQDNLVLQLCLLNKGLDHIVERLDVIVQELVYLNERYEK